MADGRAAHVVVAPDKFKGSLTATDAAAAIARGLRSRWPAREMRLVPMADGGEGTVDAFVASGWDRIACRVSGPLGEPVVAAFAFAAASARGPAAVIEMAAAAGLGVMGPAARDPLGASTYGVGELVRAALDRGARHVVVALGGSATTDGGAGFLEALGVRLTTSGGSPIARGGGALLSLAHVDVAFADARLRAVTFEAAVDVANPLTGPTGASRCFAPQKGATPANVLQLEAGLDRFAELTMRALSTDVRSEAGCGAAGGLGFALRAYCGATIRSGVDVVADIRGLSEALDGATCCFTGEGAVDAQTLGGKTVAGVAARARTAGVPTIAFTGSVDAAAEAALTDVVVVPIADGPLAHAESLARADELLERAAARIARVLSFRSA